MEHQLENALPGTLRISERNGSKQYYHCVENKRGKYIRKDDYGTALALAQQDYNRKILKELKDELRIIDSFYDKYNPKSLLKVYSLLHKNKRELVKPLILSDEEFIQQWKEVEYYKMGFREGMPEYYTDEGERVRSKSEIIIANKLSKMGIPYRYEYPIYISNYQELHPDFFCLNVRTRNEYIWEHFGIMDQPEYAKNTVKKIEEYEKAGYFLGVNFIATFESTDRPLNVRLLEKTIERYLL